jgi:hypothetical protein
MHPHLGCETPGPDRGKRPVVDVFAEGRGGIRTRYFGWGDLRERCWSQQLRGSVGSTSGQFGGALLRLTPSLMPAGGSEVGFVSSPVLLPVLAAYGAAGWRPPLTTIAFGPSRGSSGPASLRTADAQTVGARAAPTLPASAGLRQRSARNGPAHVARARLTAPRRSFRRWPVGDRGDVECRFGHGSRPARPGRRRDVVDRRMRVAVTSAAAAESRVSRG